MTALLIMGGVLGAGMILVIHGTLFKTRWGINTDENIECPGCHNVHGQLRVPANLHQTLWGGSTCSNCGVEVDKWNRPLKQ
jgi:hypothetical protein